MKKSAHELERKKLCEMCQYLELSDLLMKLMVYKKHGRYCKAKSKAMLMCASGEVSKP